MKKSEVGYIVVLALKYVLALATLFYKYEIMDKKLQEAIETFNTGEYSFSNFSQEILDNEDFALVIIKENAGNITEISERLQNDLTFLVSAASTNGCILDYICDEAKSNRDIVIAAINNDPQSIEFVDSSLYDDDEIV